VGNSIRGYFATFISINTTQHFESMLKLIKNVYYQFTANYLQLFVQLLIIIPKGLFPEKPYTK